MYPDLETFFHKMLFQHIFPENAAQIGVRISDEIAPPPDQRQRSQKRASGSKRAIKPGVQGACPRPSFSPFLGRNGDPRRVGGATGRCAPRWLPSHPPQRVRSTGLPLVGGPGLDWRRLAPAGWVPARSRAGIQAFSRESPDAKSRGGWPPAPPFLGPARWHSLVLAVVPHCSGRWAITGPMYVP